MTVSIIGARFFAYHGFYPEEQLLGTEFLLDIEVSFEPTLLSDELKDTVNYEQLYKIACEEMKITRKLLETVVAAIIVRIKNTFEIDAIRVELKKLNPPLGGPVAYSSVKMIWP